MFSICLTHDIEALEHPYSSLRGLVKGFTQDRSRKLALDYVMGKESARRNPYDTFERIIELERKYNARSTFFASPMTSKKNTELVQTIRDRGWEVALHGTHESFLLASTLWKQKAVIEQALGTKVYGIRHHRLDLRIPRTFELQRICGFSYDSSFFPPRYGQKRLHRPFLAVEGLLEIPLAFMDSDFSEMTLTRFGGLDKAWARIEAILEEFRANEGVCTVLWHPHAFYDEKNDYHKTHYGSFEKFAHLYEKILEYGSGNGARMCSCNEISEGGNRTKERFW
jgi:peptidoglycan/xylan/chitin deacetylase (PgdA/CDA1 family)